MGFIEDVAIIGGIMLVSAIIYSATTTKELNYAEEICKEKGLELKNIAWQKSKPWQKPVKIATIVCE